MKTIVSIILLLVLLSGCVEQKQAPKEQVPQGAKAVVDLAKKDLAERLNIPEEEIKVENIISVEWPDSSLGYPEPGLEYEQEANPGYVIFLLAEGELYEYHSDYERIAPPKEHIKIPKVPPTNEMETSARVVELAKKDLAERLKISEASIEVLKVISVEWQDASLGYPEPGVVYAQVITPGYVILLSAEEKIYEYHSDYERVVAPPELRLLGEK